MYSDELDSYLKSKNYCIGSTDYLRIIDTCPQINHIKYNASTDTFSWWTTDGYHFEVSVFFDEKEN